MCAVMPLKSMDFLWAKYTILAQRGALSCSQLSSSNKIPLRNKMPSLDGRPLSHTAPRAGF